MASKAANALQPGDRGRVKRSALIGDTKGNKYLDEWAEVVLNEMPAIGTEDEMYVEVSSDDRLHVSFIAEGARIRVVEPPEPADEGLVWIDELRRVD